MNRVKVIMLSNCMRAACARQLCSKRTLILSKTTVVYRRKWLNSPSILQSQLEGTLTDGTGWVPGRGLATAMCLLKVCKDSSVPVTADQFKLIYRFPGIRFCRTLSRLKLMQTSITLILLPPVYYLYWLGDLSYTSTVYSTGIAVFATVMLYSISYYLRRIIGMMYLNEAGTIIKVSHLTFWGQRNDRVLPVENVMALTETGDNQNEILLQFKQYNSPEVLYFTVRFGQIMDKNKFVHVFGKFL
ncbi:hypothetical protein NDU88_002980 [Pleurodeles waltl]|uniref:Transmembrane protein 186 n=1 Tax=Pleurodeles waltl TaxID=8319 RepID=A0AAV7M5K8_PLEWA|nr:hypothetical protein NDU88_002980 [Pleurodeles waltl]